MTMKRVPLAIPEELDSEVLEAKYRYGFSSKNRLLTNAIKDYLRLRKIAGHKPSMDITVDGEPKTYVFSS